MHMDRKLDTASLTALFCIFLGWFFIDTLTVTLGLLRHGVRFYELPEQRGRREACQHWRWRLPGVRRQPGARRFGTARI